MVTKLLLLLPLRTLLLLIQPLLLTQLLLKLKLLLTPQLLLSNVKHDVKKKMTAGPQAWRFSFDHSSTLVNSGCKDSDFEVIVAQ